jgi:hypothetical protein
MLKLKELEALGNRRIDDNGIRNINLEKSNANYNQKITDANHMKKKMEELDALGCCWIDDNCVININFEKLNAADDQKIKES